VRVFGGWGVEGEAGLAEESGDEGEPSLDAVQLVSHRCSQLVGGAGARLPWLFFIAGQAPSTWLRSGA
jgi:hypothetical protein